jgi:hypothetical protein
MTLLISGLVALTGIFCRCAPAEAVDTTEPAPATASQPKYGAIAYDQTNCSWGTSWNAQSKAAADARALSECTAGGGTTNCRVTVDVGPDQCGAFAKADKCDGFGWAARSDTRAAQQEALRQCQSANPGLTCTITATVCSSR